jgi:hypothetical protein
VYANTFAPQRIVGKLLRFNKGDYIAGENNDSIAVGTIFTANVEELQLRWTKWIDNKVVDEHAALAVNNKISPSRAELGDDDESKWPLDDGGQPRDPWRFAAYLPLLSEQSELFTFVANSRGSHSAIADLSRRYLNHNRRHADVFPKIKVDVGSYQHKVRAYGRIKVPDFVPAGWAPKSLFASALVAAGYAAAELESEAIASDPAEDKSFGDDDPFRDEIPFN